MTRRTPLTRAWRMVALAEPGTESPREILIFSYWITVTAAFEILLTLCFDTALAPRSRNVTAFLSADFYETQLVKSWVTLGPAGPLPRGGLVRSHNWSSAP